MASDRRKRKSKSAGSTRYSTCATGDRLAINVIDAYSQPVVMLHSPIEPLEQKSEGAGDNHERQESLR